MSLTKDDATKTIEASGKDLKIFRDSQGRAILGVVLMDEDGDNLLSLVQEGESASGVKGLFIMGEDSDGNISPLQINGDTKALLTIDAAHGEIHKGHGFTHSAKHTVADEANLDTLFINPAGNEAHLRYLVVSSAAPVDILLFEGTTVSDNGTPEVVFNNDRNSNITNNMTLFEGPTVTDTGTQIEFNLIAGERKVGGTGESPVIEWELKEDTKYLLRATNNSGAEAIIAHTIFWYEPS